MGNLWTRAKTWLIGNKAKVSAAALLVLLVFVVFYF
jgi:hypothetical protein